MTSSTGSEATSRPIVAIRALNYSWAEVDLDDPTGRRAISCKGFRVEIRHEGDVEWTEIPVIEVAGKPPG